MSEFFTSPLFCITLSLAAYCIGCRVRAKTGSALANPLIVAAVLIGVVLFATGTDVEAYYEATDMIRFWIMPATAVLGVAIYKNLTLIRKQWLPVLGGCLVGALTAIGSVVVLAKAFGLERELAVGLAPKSVTMAIATSLSEQHGGLVPITVFGVVLTGVLGAVAAPLLIRLLRIKDPTEAGLAIGASSHAVGTSTAVQLGEIEGAMSGAAIGLVGIFTVLLALALPYVL